jgi:hypothetical protein
VVTAETSAPITKAGKRLRLKFFMLNYESFSIFYLYSPPIRIFLYDSSRDQNSPEYIISLKRVTLYP